MEYTPIIRFSDIVGQEKAKRILQQAILRSRLPHAYLFTGIPGVGKTSMAMALAAAINCKSRLDTEACGQCVHCRQLKGGNFPDFCIIRPEAGSLKIQQIRELQQMMRFAPLASGYRVTVLDQADAMTEEASNAFLKTLEEPPKNNLFILNAVEPANLLPTIVSRCQKVAFLPLRSDTIMRHLISKRQIPESLALVLARLAEGSLGRALAMEHSDFVDKRRLWVQKAMEIPRLSQAKVLDLAQELSEEKSSARTATDKYEIGGLLDLLGILAMWYRDLLLLKGGGSEDLVMNADFVPELKKIAKNLTLLELYKSLLALDQAQKDIRMRRNPTLVMERTMLQLRELSSTRG